MLRLGSSNVDYNPEFRLYMATKLPNPHYLPEICINVTVVNFTVTKEGLHEQLLADTVRQEQPELQAEQDHLVASIAHDRDMLQDLEDKMLHFMQVRADSANPTSRLWQCWPVRYMRQCLQISASPGSATAHAPVQRLGLELAAALGQLHPAPALCSCPRACTLPESTEFAVPAQA